MTPRIRNMVSHELHLMLNNCLIMDHLGAGEPRYCPGSWDLQCFDQLLKSSLVANEGLNHAGTCSQSCEDKSRGFMKAAIYVRPHLLVPVLHSSSHLQLIPFHLIHIFKHDKNGSKDRNRLLYVPSQQGAPTCTRFNQLNDRQHVWTCEDAGRS
jgi:hypothetical protein